MKQQNKRGMNHINAMRRNRSLLQKQLAILLGHATYRRVSHYESGSSLPPLQTALLLEVALGVRLPELYPNLYRHCQELVLKRAQHLPYLQRRALIGRLLHEDLPYEHTRTG